MALTQAQWYEKLKSFLPPWFWATENLQVGHAQALAEILKTLQDDGDDHLAETFLTTATGKFLLQHGAERGIDKLSGESDDTYRERIRSISNRGNIVAITALVESLVTSGVITIKEHWRDADFFDRDVYCNRRGTFMKTRVLMFSVIIETQTQDIYDALVAALDEARVLGVLYQVIIAP